MLNQFAQPKGSTIGLLEDGRTVEEAILELTTQTLSGDSFCPLKVSVR